MCDGPTGRERRVLGTVTDQTTGGRPEPEDLVWLDERAGPWFAQPAWARVINLRPAEYPPGWWYLDVQMLDADGFGAGAVTVRVRAGSVVVRRQH